jgi:hypothetical protein
MIGTGSILSRTAPDPHSTVALGPDKTEPEEAADVEQPVELVERSLPEGAIAFGDSGDRSDAAEEPSADSVAPATLRPRPSEVLLIGDSIAREIQPLFQNEMTARNIGFNAITFPGMAACDLIEALELHMVTASPDVVIVLFTGNAITPCMANASDPTSDVYFDTYQSDVATMVGLIGGEAVDIWLVGALPYADEPTMISTARLGETLAAVDGVDGTIEIADLFVDEQASYGTDLPCRLPAEPCPTVRVRASDGIHLGDDGTDNLFGRSRMLSGITRFMNAIYQ